MKLLGNTREIEIITENCHRVEESYRENSGIKYPLYEANYISGIRMIFQKAIMMEKKKRNKHEEIYMEETSNILSFVGARGTGKTTVMNEFCSILSKMELKKRINWWFEHTLKEKDREFLFDKNFYFHILKPIDASLLADKEDLFELILANLYREFEDKIQYETYGYKDNESVRKVLNDFSEIAKLYRSVIAHEAMDYENTFISKLQLVKGSQQIQEKIANLVDNLFSIQERADYEYIVIAIDDLDLNLRHGYEMLEQLQKYFSYHKIVVLVTLDYEQMQLICEEYFGKAMDSTSKCYPSRQQNRLLANDYMTKVFPLSQRMYMPERGRISKKSEIKLPNEVFNDVEKKKLAIVVKQFILLKIAEAMEIYYDACGLKNHFSEPETVRSLVFFNKFLESLEEIDYVKLKTHEEIRDIMDEKERHIEEEYNNEVLRKYDQNHERFNTDINVRMVQNILNYEQKVAFDMLKKRDLERRARYFVCAKRTEQRIIFGNINNKSYAYGDLLEKIYRWGEENAQGDYFLDKPLIRCILASFTSEMICEYIKYRHHCDEGERKKHKTRLLGFIGESFSSHWLAEAFPKVSDVVLNELLYSNEKDEKVQKVDNAGEAKNTSDNKNEETETSQIQEAGNGESEKNIVVNKVQPINTSKAQNIAKINMGTYLYGNSIQQKNISFDISLKELERIKNRNIDENEEINKVRTLDCNIIKSTIKKWLDTTQIIQILECVDMLFIRREGSQFKGITYKFEATNSNTSNDAEPQIEKNVNSEKAENTKVVRVTGEDVNNVTLDIMGFVAKSMNYKEVAEGLYSNILMGMEEFLCNYFEVDKLKNGQKIRNIINKTVKKELLEKSLFSDYINNNGIDINKLKEDVAFPYYNLDMSYNIFKRVREHYKNKTIKSEEVFANLVEFYEYIGQLLEKEAEKYEGSENFKYAQIYQNCPYIRVLSEWKKSESKISYVLKGILKSMSLNPIGVQN